METTAKEFVTKYVESFTEKQCEDLLFLINMAQGFKDKSDIMRFVGLYQNVDSARPQPWSDKMRDEMQADPMWYVWSYQKTRIFGKPEHLLEALINKICVDLKG
jgi:hypothetical protein